MANKEDLYINGLMIEDYKVDSSIGLGEDAVSYVLPSHVLIERKNADRVVVDLSQEDIDALGSVFRVDLDKYVNKKVKFLLQIVGPKDRQ